MCAYVPNYQRKRNDEHDNDRGHDPDDKDDDNGLLRGVNLLAQRRPRRFAPASAHAQQRSARGSPPWACAKDAGDDYFYHDDENSDKYLAEAVGGLRDAAIPDRASATGLEQRRGAHRRQQRKTC